jgi:hypothetical protein
MVTRDVVKHISFLSVLYVAILPVYTLKSTARQCSFRTASPVHHRPRKRGSAPGFRPVSP